MSGQDQHFESVIFVQVLANIIFDDWRYLVLWTFWPYLVSCGMDEL